ncbi:MAG: hypothetical protein K9I26_01200 [Flavobacterium sp.]|nr:hypothetical protein [Flavobacterium sp.]
MKKIIWILIITFFYSCSSNSSSESEVPDDDSTLDSEVPNPRSYTTYTSQNSVTLNGVIDNSNNYYQGPGTYKVGFIFRTGNAENTNNQKFIIVDESVEYAPDIAYFKTTINSLSPNIKYFYTCFTKNGAYEEYDWEEFTTSEIPCTQSQNNYVNFEGIWSTVYPTIDDPSCCDEGNFGIRFGSWPNIYEINFNELDNGLPKTGQYFGVDYEFDISGFNKQVVKSSNQVLIGSSSTPNTKLFVTNNGTTLTITFCNTTLRDGSVLNGKVSVAIP